MTNTIIVLLMVVSLILVGNAILLYRWTNTKHGKLDTRTAIFLKILALTGSTTVERTWLEMRKVADKSAMLLVGASEPFENIKNFSIPGPSGMLPIRIYTPQGVNNAPIVLVYHGGGWMLSNLDTVDKFCRSLAKKTSAIIVSVDYRLAPENPFPAAVNDSYAALCWVQENAESINGDSNRIAVLGSSSGGNLATVVALLAREKNGPQITAQVLLYPVTNSQAVDTSSYLDFADGFFLTKQQMEIFINAYLPNLEDRKNPLASPLLAQNLKRLPPAMVTTCEFDPLRDEGEAYARRLQEANVPVNYICYNCAFI
ncbi:MAG: alpha/beta hydrolase [Bacillota bacterium]|nr:alpha/beta hydrolase [Bacillota bacterium]